MGSRTTEMVRVLAVYLAFCFSFAGCSSDRRDSDTENEVLSDRQCINLPFGGDVCLDCTDAYFEDEILILHNVYEGLFRIVTDNDGNEKTENAGCSSYVVSTDGKRYMFYLRRDCLWSDGKRVVSSDYVYAWKKLMSHGSESPYSIYTGNIREIDCIDDYVFYVDLFERDSSFIKKLSMVCFFPEREDAENLEIPQRPFNGPFVIASFADGSIVLEKNETYWNRFHIDLDEVDFYLCTDEKEQASMFEDGKLDMIFVSNPELIKRFSFENKHNDLSFEKLKSSFVYYIAFNLNEDRNTLSSRLIHNSSVRLALSLAIDREKMNELFFDGNEQPALSLIPYGISCGSFDYRNAVEESLAAYSAQIKIPGFINQLFERGLKECGYEEKDGPISFTLCVENEESFSEELFDWLDSELEKKLGVHINVIHSSSYTDESEYNEAYDMYLTNWSSDFNDPSGYLDVFYDTDGNSLTGGYHDRFYGMLLAASEKTTDENERLKLFAKAEDYLVNSAGCIPLVFMNEYVCIKPYVRNVSFITCGPSVEFLQSRVVVH